MSVTLYRTARVRFVPMNTTTSTTAGAPPDELRRAMYPPPQSTTIEPPPLNDLARRAVESQRRLRLESLDAWARRLTSDLAEWSD